MRAVQITRFGGPEVLTVTTLPDPVPRAGEVLVRVEAAGVNYADTHQAEDSYLAPQHLPLVPGSEVVGHSPDGRRLAAFAPHGGYAELAAVPEALAVTVPDGVDAAAATALLVQGTTAWHLLTTSARLAPGESVLVHAGAGGVGTLAIQLARRMGAGTVIATASSPDKRALAARLGADVVLAPDPATLTEEVREATGGRGVDVVLEMVGDGVFDASLVALATFGRLVTYGMASRRPPTPVVPAALMAHSTAVVGFWLTALMATPQRVVAPLAELMALVDGGELEVVVGGRYPLESAPAAHEALRSRSSIGKLALLPGLSA